jgi:hypothetical protein
MGNKIYVLISITRIKNNFMYIIQLHKEIEIYRNSKYSWNRLKKRLKIRKNKNKNNWNIFKIISKCSRKSGKINKINNIIQLRNGNRVRIIMIL